MDDDGELFRELYPGLRAFAAVVGPGVLVPRPETELLVDVALAEARNHARPTILEVGTGSGCVAIATARELGGRARVVATEVSPAALAFARLNRDTLGAEVELILGSLAGVVRTATIIQANLPYIPAAEIDALEPEVSRWEPRVALDGGVDGFALREGRAPDQLDEVVIDAATATNHNITLGDTVRVQADTEAALRVVGLVGFGDADGLPDTTIALTSLATAQRLLNLGDGISQINVIAADGTTTSSLAERLRADLGKDVDVSASQDTAAASAAAAKSQLGFITGALLALAGLLAGGAVLKGAFGEGSSIVDKDSYNDGPVKVAAIAALFWGVAGFVVGDFIAWLDDPLKTPYPVIGSGWLGYYHIMHYEGMKETDVK